MEKSYEIQDFEKIGFLVSESSTTELAILIYLFIPSLFVAFGVDITGSIDTIFCSSFQEQIVTLAFSETA
ncbi:hypothetical protein RO3G_00536 [Rhizopus delemar RA 99-880]|uniref:Uncharacterized protein n=1 Tax=Rhizopus delemar (strain RA 99-880 / ATCC MYA-4621 / FGSC 9543 / NRRL 43880) TaxID=246409 RepID=I1BI02_RHIO9|nr:hypothetical protein RO3G_00536 [Rhizopus delemar RA 99-880]|eukprot:EIE75832.1 hypothetical protein RO3G_00536 [Rhizopus delemar RA 99-880]